MKKEWIYVLSDTQQQQIKTLQQELKINLSLCEILVKRGITTYKKAKNFFRPNFQNLHDPFLMKGMEKAVNHIITLAQQNKKIIFYGDYDVDGTTSVTLMIYFFKTFFPQSDFLYFIPNRLTDGYGLTKNGVNFILENKADLLITLDCGIKSVEEINHLNSNHIQTIICDHHLPDTNNLPAAYAIINPKQTDCKYPFKELCACGITFKLIQALLKTLNKKDDFLQKLIEYVGLATSADIVPLIDENRIFVTESIKKINSNPSLPLKALIQAAELSYPLSNQEFVFHLTPRINAAGRMNTAQRIIELFLENDFDQALNKANELNLNNTERKKINDKITIEIEKQIADAPISDSSFTIVKYNPNWHKGVLGIIASRLVEKYNKPAIIFTKSNGKLVGSARSIEGINLVEILDKCKNHLNTYGGHAFAAGLSLAEKKMPAFEKQFENEIKQQLNNTKPIPKIYIDSKINFKDITSQFYNIIEQMEPFGPLNRNPVFLTAKVSIENIQVLKEKHLTININQHNTTFKAIMFNAIERKTEIEQKREMDLVYKIKTTNWRGNKQIGIIIEDIH